VSLEFIVKLANMEFHEHAFSCSRVLLDGPWQGGCEETQFFFQLLLDNKMDLGKVRLVSLTYNEPI
jgi:hypothetical protein